MEDYDLDEDKVIGSGSSGTVFLVTRKSDSRQLVAKRIALDALESEDERTMAIKEATTMASMRHLNIVAFEDFFRAEIREKNYMFIVMEYCRGGSLQSRIRAQKGSLFARHQIAQWLRMICLALAHMHRRGVMHRDLKPENVFLTEDGVVKIGDFGIAVITAASTALGKTAIGTIMYMAPEILTKDDVDTKYDYSCDLWSLGAMLYELIALKPPFQAKSMYALCSKIKEAKYEPLSNSAPSELREVVHQLLNPSPLERPKCNEIMERDFMKPNAAWSSSDILLVRSDDEVKKRLEEMQTTLERKVAEVDSLQEKLRFQCQGDEEVNNRLNKVQSQLERKDAELKRLREESFIQLQKEGKLHKTQEELRAKLERKDAETLQTQEDSFIQLQNARKLMQDLKTSKTEAKKDADLVQHLRTVNKMLMNEIAKLKNQQMVSAAQAVTEPAPKAAKEDPEAVEELERWKKKFEKNGDYREWKWTLLHFVCYKGVTTVVSLLLKRGEHSDVKDKNGFTPLHQATIGGHLEVVKMLLSHNADINGKNYDNRTPLHFASNKGHLEVVRLLLQKGADVNTQDDTGNTPFSWADIVPIRTLLLQHGAS